MAEGKKSVLLYCDFLFTVEKMDDETAGKFFKHYLNYINDNDPITDNLVVDIAFESVKQNLKRDLKKWEKRAEASRSNGSKGGRPKKPKKPTGLIENLDEPRKPVTDTVTVTVTDTVTGKVIPTLETFVAHAVKRKPNVCTKDVELKYYAWIDNEWSINRKGVKQPIKNWKSSLTNTIKYLNERYKDVQPPIEETIEERIKRLNNEAKAGG